MAWLRLFSLVLLLVAACVCSNKADHDPVIAALVARIDALEKQGQQQQTLFGAQNERLAQQEITVQSQNERLAQQEMTVQSQNERLAQQEMTIQSQNERLVQQELTIQSLLDWKEQHQDCQPFQRQQPTASEQPEDRHANDDLDADQTVNRVKDIRDDTDVIEITKNKGIDHKRGGRSGRALMYEGQVAFHAVISGADSPPIATHQPIVFNVEKLNIGGGYHSTHGLFTAPAPGIYILSVSVMSHNREHLSVSLMKNGALLARVVAESEAAGQFDQGSVTVVAQAAIGDEFWVQHYVGSTPVIYGDYYSSFMGCLVTPL